MILVCYGTRPEYLKLKPLLDEMAKRDIDHSILFTGQHKDIAPANGYSVYELKIQDGENRLDSIISSILNMLDEKFFKPFQYILVQGDTTSALGIALTEFHHKKKVIHLEAGLRTYDKQNPYPEELNRQLISSIADIHFCPTENNWNNLNFERKLHIAPDMKMKKISDAYVVGNTALDNLVQWKDLCEYGKKILITLHRRENHSKMSDYFKIIDALAEKHSDFEFILPIHPNPNVSKLKSIFEHVKVIDPLSHYELLEILVKSRLVITDSGGLQEEASFFNKKCIVCRKVTERQESIDVTSFLVDNPMELYHVFEQHIDNYTVNAECPYGTGNAAKNIVDILQKEYSL